MPDRRFPSADQQNSDVSADSTAGVRTMLLGIQLSILGVALQGGPGGGLVLVGAFVAATGYLGPIVGPPEDVD